MPSFKNLSNLPADPFFGQSLAAMKSESFFSSSQCDAEDKKMLPQQRQYRKEREFRNQVFRLAELDKGLALAFQRCIAEACEPVTKPSMFGNGIDAARLHAVDLGIPDFSSTERRALDHSGYKFGRWVERQPRSP